MVGVWEMIGEMIASAVVKQIAGKLDDLAAGEVALQWGFKDDALKLAGKMEDLEAVMHDADNKLRQGGTSGEAVERWLTKLSSVAYDAEDVLDELAATELIKKIQPKSQSRLLKAQVELMAAMLRPQEKKLQPQRLFSFLFGLTRSMLSRRQHFFSIKSRRQHVCQTECPMKED